MSDTPGHANICIGRRRTEGGTTVQKRLLLPIVIMVAMTGCFAREFGDVPAIEGVYSAPPKIRVMLVDRASSSDGITLSTQGRYAIYSATPTAPLLTGSNLAPSRIQVDDRGVALGGRYIDKGRVTVTATRRGFIGVEGRLYHGTVVIVPHDGDRFSLVNEVDVENYLRGVIACEAPADWPSETLRAHAIASRTWTLHEIKKKGGAKLADVRADIYSQVYKGVGAETKVADQAVKASRGIIMLYERKLFPAYYCSACGGHTANAYTVWHEYKIAPLAGVPDPYCALSAYRSWRQSYSKRQIISALQKAYPQMKLPDLLEIIPTDISPSGHAERVKLLYPTGFYDISGDKLRKDLGRDSSGILALRSTRFSVVRVGDTFWFQGRGNGHGVGMCQWGAREMGVQGKGSREILQHYYPKSRLWRVY